MQYNTKCVISRCFRTTKADKLPIFTNNAVPNTIGSYRRYTNQNLEKLKETILSLYDNKKSAITICSSGMLAYKVLLDNMRDKNIIVLNKCYFELKQMIYNFYIDYNVKLIDIRNSKILEASLQDDSLVLIDSVDCMMLDDFNVKDIIELAHKHNSKVCVDNTVLSSYYYNPFNDGADYVIESLTKYCGGHGDVIAGALIGYSNDIYNGLNGISLDPLSCYLLQRGISTLPLRLDRITATSQKVVKYLKSKTDNVKYYGIGGLIVFTCGSRNKNNEFIKSLTKILNTTSFGQDNTTISLSFPKEVNDYPNIPNEYKEYIRLSVGLEDYRDIIADLEKGFKVLELLKWEW